MADVAFTRLDVHLAGTSQCGCCCCCCCCFPLARSNYEYDASERSIVELFEKYGRVKRIDMKTGAHCWHRTPRLVWPLQCLASQPTPSRHAGG